MSNSLKNPDHFGSSKIYYVDNTQEATQPAVNFMKGPQVLPCSPRQGRFRFLRAEVGCRRDRIGLVFGLYDARVR